MTEKRKYTITDAERRRRSAQIREMNSQRVFSDEDRQKLAARFRKLNTNPDFVRRRVEAARPINSARMKAVWAKAKAADLE